MSEVSNDPVKVEQRLSPDRLSSYMDVTGGKLPQALDLYKWNIALSGALFEAIAVVEVVVRNEIDSNLRTWAQSRGADWMDIAPLDEKGRADIAKARSRNTKNPSHGKVLAELNFGFWRFLVANRYLHTIWIPAMNSAFPNLGGHPGERRKVIERSIERLWFLRNRIGHHEPIHTRNVNRDIAAMTSLLDWICLDTSSWATAQRRVQEVLLRRPSLE
ncbi:MAG: hypothetical protein Q8L08_02325 [Candidatus Nanopelagicaceae bacterium]|nr:hypothetical protein [Candidatus Nanopelagicaceae bacterium]